MLYEYLGPTQHQDPLYQLLQEVLTEVVYYIHLGVDQD